MRTSHQRHLTRKAASSSSSGDRSWKRTCEGLSSSACRSAGRPWWSTRASPRSARRCRSSRSVPPARHVIRPRGHQGQPVSSSWPCYISAHAISAHATAAAEHHSGQCQPSVQHTRIGCECLPSVRETEPERESEKGQGRCTQTPPSFPSPPCTRHKPATPTLANRRPLKHRAHTGVAPLALGFRN